jgi:hypothetical protein
MEGVQVNSPPAVLREVRITDLDIVFTSGRSESIQLRDDFGDGLERTAERLVVTLPERRDPHTDRRLRVEEQIEIGLAHVACLKIRHYVAQIPVPKEKP